MARSALPQGCERGEPGQVSLLRQTSRLPRRRAERGWGKVDFAQAASQQSRRTPIGHPDCSRAACPLDQRSASFRNFTNNCIAVRLARTPVLASTRLRRYTRAPERVIDDLDGFGLDL